MAKARGREHTSLTETAALVVRELYKLPNLKMIAPGEIKTTTKRGGKRFVTAVYTTAGMELLISGQSTQRVSVHTTTDAHTLFKALQRSKGLKNFTFNERERMPGI